MTDPRITDKAVEKLAASMFEAVHELDWSQAEGVIRAEWLSRARAALEAALPHLAPQPLLLDREAVERAIATKVMYYDSATAVHEVDDGDLAGLTAGTDAVMELTRPMPTHPELAEWLREIFSTDADPEGTTWDTAAECLLALINGSAG